MLRSRVLHLLGLPALVVFAGAIFLGVAPSAGAAQSSLRFNVVRATATPAIPVGGSTWTSTEESGNCGVVTIAGKSTGGGKFKLQAAILLARGTITSGQVVVKYGPKPTVTKSFAWTIGHILKITWTSPIKDVTIASGHDLRVQVSGTVGTTTGVCTIGVFTFDVDD